MSHFARIEDFFGDRRHVFQFAIGELMELEEARAEAFRKAGFGPGHGGVMALHGRLAEGLFLTDDIKDILRIGLIGGGMEREPAYLLVERHVVPGALANCAKLAGRVTSAILIGVPDDTPGAGKAGEDVGPPVPIQPGFPTDGSDGAGSTASAALSE